MPCVNDKRPPSASSPIRSRPPSPGCRPASSAPAPAAQYRESNSSRLRQEMKGMTLSGIVKQGPRSQSLSPVQRSQNSSPTRSQTIEIVTPKLPSRHDSEKTIDLNATPRTTSETSCTSRDTDKSKHGSSAPCGHAVADTHSKTLNIVLPVRAPSSCEGNAPRRSGELAPNLCIPSNVTSGYGKPLVTPTKKKLTIRRDFSLQESARTNGKSPILSRSKPPVNSCTATKEATSANSLRASSTAPNVRRDLTPNDVPGGKPRRPLSSSVLRPTRSPAKETKLYIKPPVIAKNLSPKTKLTRNDSKDASKIPTSLRNPSTEKLKQQFCRDMPVYASGRPNSAIHSNRSFKPQLEDIKSSYLLLSKKIPSRVSSKTPLNDEKIPAPVPKPKALDENERKVQLVKVKEKFQSRRFQAESKYENIEGLNWISWK